jgi:uncharacterized protein YgiM (DUF1202 family)
VISFIKRRHGFGRIFPPLTALLIACLTVSGLAWLDASGALAQEEEPITLNGVIGGTATYLYDEASNDIVTEMMPGDRVTVYARSEDGMWYAVENAQRLAGWAEADAVLVSRPSRLPAEDVTLTPIEPEPESAPEPMAQADSSSVANLSASEPVTPTMATVNTEDMRLNVRSGPGRGNDVIGKALPGETYDVVGISPGRGWLEIEMENGLRGWVSRDYVLVDGEEPAETSDDEASEEAGASKSKGAEPQNSEMAAPAMQTVSKNAGAAGLGGKIVFQNVGGRDIYIYELGSGRLYPLTTGIDPSFSPDGSQVVFTRGGGETGIYLIDVDGGDERKIFGERELLRSPKFSPDGQYIVFSRGDEFIECYDIGGRCLTKEWINGNMPWFTFADKESRIERHFKLARIDTNGGSYQDLPVLTSAVAPDWNSGGVVHQSNSGIQITQDGSNDQPQLVYFDILKQYHNDPDWQPNGGRILFQQKEASHWEIYTVNPDGTDRVALTRPEFTLVDELPSNASAAWSPDGQHIVFISNREPDHEAGAWRLWVMNADGSNQRPLPVNVAIEYGFDSAQMVDWGP